MLKIGILVTNRYLPKEGAHTLITSRNTNAGVWPLNHSFELKPLEMSESEDLLVHLRMTELPSDMDVETAFFSSLGLKPSSNDPPGLPHQSSAPLSGSKQDAMKAMMSPRRAKIQPERGQLGKLKRDRSFSVIAEHKQTLTTSDKLVLRDLAKETKGLPLALVLAGRYVRETGLPWNAYLDKLRDKARVIYHEESSRNSSDRKDKDAPKLKVDVNAGSKKSDGKGVSGNWMEVPHLVVLAAAWRLTLAHVRSASLSLPVDPLSDLAPSSTNLGSNVDVAGNAANSHRRTSVSGLLPAPAPLPSIDLLENMLRLASVFGPQNVPPSLLISYYVNRASAAAVAALNVADEAARSASNASSSKGVAAAASAAAKRAAARADSAHAEYVRIERETLATVAKGIAKLVRLGEFSR